MNPGKAARSLAALPWRSRAPVRWRAATAAEASILAEQAWLHGEVRLVHGSRAPRTPSTKPSNNKCTTAGDEACREHWAQEEASQDRREGSTGPR